MVVGLEAEREEDLAEVKAAVDWEAERVLRTKGNEALQVVGLVLVGLEADLVMVKVVLGVEAESSTLWRWLLNRWSFNG